MVSVIFYRFNWKRDDDFDDGLSTHAAAPPTLNFGLLNVRGTYNAANVASAQLAMYKIYSIAAIRSALKYANKAYNNGTFQEKYLAEGWAYWRSASGHLGVFEIWSFLGWIWLFVDGEFSWIFGHMSG